MSDMNKEVVRKMIERLEAVPQSFDQSAYWIYEDGEAPCGTVACLGGEAVICAAPTLEEGIAEVFFIKSTGGPGTSVPERADQILGLENQKHAIYASDAGGWPDPYGARYREARINSGRKAAAAVVVSYLKEALERGTMVW